MGACGAGDVIMDGGEGGRHIDGVCGYKTIVMSCTRVPCKWGLVLLLPEGDSVLCGCVNHFLCILPLLVSCVLCQLTGKRKNSRHSRVNSTCTKQCPHVLCPVVHSMGLNMNSSIDLQYFLKMFPTSTTPCPSGCSPCVCIPRHIHP